MSEMIKITEIAEFVVDRSVDNTTHANFITSIKYYDNNIYLTQS